MGALIFCLSLRCFSGAELNGGWVFVKVNGIRYLNGVGYFIRRLDSIELIS